MLNCSTFYQNNPRYDTTWREQFTYVARAKLNIEEQYSSVPTFLY